MSKTIGKFILFEGGDASGKSTQLTLAETFLKSQDYQVLVTREPGSKHVASNEILRHIVKTDARLNAVEREMLFMADALAHKRFVETEMRKNPNLVVLCDRGYYSHLVYQTATYLINQLNATDLKRFKNIVEWAVLKPDATLIFNASIETTKARIGKRGGTDVIEGLGSEFLSHVADEYAAIKKGHKVFLVDANRDVDSIALDVKNILMKAVRR